MAYVKIPKDIDKVKSKFIFSLTLRQTVCFLLAAMVGFPIYFLTRDSLGGSGATLVLILSVLPFFFFAFSEHNGQYPEEYLLSLIRTVLYKREKRIYKVRDKFYILSKENEDKK